MGRYYVDITDVPRDVLTFMGYMTAHEDDDFILLVFKGEEHIIPRHGPQYLFVEDMNDAHLLKRQKKVPAPVRKS